jgi:hypothetical protein
MIIFLAYLIFYNLFIARIKNKLYKLFWAGIKYELFGGMAAGLAWRNINLFDLFKLISNKIELIWSKDGLPKLKKFQIKYGIGGN